MNFGKVAKSRNVLFYQHQSITYESGHELMLSYMVLWCLPNNKIQQGVKIGKFIKYENVLFYEQQVLENMRGPNLGHVWV